MIINMIWISEFIFLFIIINQIISFVIIEIFFKSLILILYEVSLFIYKQKKKKKCFISSCMFELQRVTFGKLLKSTNVNE